MMPNAIREISSGGRRRASLSGTSEPSTRNIGGRPALRWMSDAPPLSATSSRMTAVYLMGLGNSVSKRSRPRIGQVTDVRCEGVLANSPQSNETARIEDSAEGRKAKGRRAQAEGGAAQGVAQGSCAVRQ